MDGAKVQDIILMIFKESKGIDPKPEKTLVIIVDESKKNVVVTTLATANEKGLMPFDLSK